MKNKRILTIFSLFVKLIPPAVMSSYINLIRGAIGFVVKMHVLYYLRITSNKKVSFVINGKYNSSITFVRKLDFYTLYQLINNPE